jgi:ACS family sodium-dependent inorganic phosphate cotransporter
MIPYSHLANLSVGIVAMTDETSEETTFKWSPAEKGLILSSFFYGYILTQFIGGYIATLIGGNVVSYL